MAILTLTAIALLLLIFIRINHDLEANGTLQPVDQKQVFAHVDGEVDEVYVDHASKVKKGDRLLKLKNRDLEIEITALQGELQQAQEQMASLMSQINSKAMQSDQAENSV